MNPQQPLRFGMIGFFHAGDDSLVPDDRRDVASQHEEVGFPAPLYPEYNNSFTMRTSYLAFYVNDAIVSSPQTRSDLQMETVTRHTYVSGLPEARNNPHW